MHVSFKFDMKTISWFLPYYHYVVLLYIKESLNKFLPILFLNDYKIQSNEIE